MYALRVLRTQSQGVRSARHGHRRRGAALLVALLAAGMLGLGVAPAAVAAAVPAAVSGWASPASPESDEPLFNAVRGNGGAVAGVGEPVIPMDTAAAAQFVPMAPERDVDTRNSPAGPLQDGDVISLYPAEGLPPGITAVTFNIVATGQTASGYLEVAPLGAPAVSSTVNWSGPQQTIANGHMTRVTAGGAFQITLHSTGSAHVVLDVTGYFAGAGAPAATLYTPEDRRIYDSRNGDGPLAPGEVQWVSIAGGGPPPAVSPSAAAINVTATGTVGSGVFTAAAFPTNVTSTVNWNGAAQTVANAVITDVQSSGLFAVTNNGKTYAHLVIDLTGVFAPTALGATGAQFYAMDPNRSYDSRVVGGLLTAGATRTNVQPVPGTAVAIAVNTTITGTSGTGYISITPTGAPIPPAGSTVNWFASPTTRANGSIVPVTGSTSRAYVGGSYSTHYIHDVAGYFQ